MLAQALEPRLSQLVPVYKALLALVRRICQHAQRAWWPRTHALSAAPTSILARQHD